MKTDSWLPPTVIECLQEFRAEEMIPTTDDTLREVAAIEADGGIVEFLKGEIFFPSNDWGPFVSFWMDAMWAMKRRRDYVKLALVMRSINLREMRVSNPYYQDMDYWCHQAKLYQEIYFLQGDL